MPITPRPQPWTRMIGVLAMVAAIASPLIAASPGVAVLKTAIWSPGDTVREGAGEFEVFASVARLQRQHSATGLIGLGDRHGMFLNGAERALRHLALTGIPIAKVASGSDFAQDPDALFLNATGLSEADASAVMKRCLERHGPPPAVRDPANPSARDLTALRSHLENYRAAFAAACAPKLAMN